MAHRKKLAALFILVAGCSPAQSSWLSEILDGRFPPIQDVGLCIAMPSLCIVNEAGKEVIRQKKLEQERDALNSRLGEYQQNMSNLINKMNVSNERERAEVRAALNQADQCLLRAKQMTDADGCYLDAEKKIFEIHRKYQGLAPT